MVSRSLIGLRFGKLLVISKAGRISRGIRKPRPLITYNVLCECGISKIVTGQDLAFARTRSCGCSRRDSWNGAFKQAWHNYKHRAQRANYPFEFNEEDFFDIVTKPCFYCEAPPSNVAHNRYTNEYFYYNGIDRKDNTLGYTKENSLPCCDICNKAKRHLVYDDFICWLKRISNKWKD